MEELHGIIPAVDGVRLFKEFLKSPYEICVLMNVHLSLLDTVFRQAEDAHKKVILHIDRINGLSDDEYGAEYVSQRYHPAGAISIKPAIIRMLKKNHVTAIQRVFLIDSFALEKSAQSVASTEPDYVEVMPGTTIDIYDKLRTALGDKIVAGGLIPDIEYAEKLLLKFCAVTLSLQKLL